VSPGSELRVNGVTHQVDLPGHETLIETLRERLGLTGAKQACSMGNCGTCTVRLDGVTVYSCLVLSVECDESTVDTIEGLADGDRLDPVQAAFLDTDAFQCGFCTPGQVMSTWAVLDAIERPSVDDLVHGLAGNLCRCGAYEHILKAAQRAADRSAAADA
jgi:aerobic-type carbon monoxide dehydrogenase small subunit (CoxS/CutS family)